MEIDQLYNIYKQHPEICIDSRKINEGCLFFALKGETFDGNQFASVALLSGAAYAIIDDPEKNKSDKCILVTSVLECLQELASYHRKHLNIPVLAITGSNGKTTTKELCRDVLQKKFNTKATFGNLNNHIGVPLTILGTTSAVEFLIVEMGANHLGEIDFLCKIANPTYVFITNIGKAHLEGFGGVEGIKIGKTEMYRYAAKNNGKIFLNFDDEILTTMAPPGSTIIGYSSSDLVKIIEVQPFLTFSYSEIIVHTKLYGSYNQPNIAFSIAAGNYFGVETKDIVMALEAYEPENNRSQITQVGTNTIIKDAYNANPSSMKLSIESFYKMHGSNKVLVLGDMLELGEFAEFEHRQIIDLTKTLGFQNSIFVGENFMKVKDMFHGKYFKHIDEAREYFKNKNFTQALILLKGSRGISVEKIIL
ncbi:MAG: UDP-N-acetylmuramoyl-tripeptide--D-alanyl-D-alanine ligase [Saprospiraceae bacterium]|nr:UDP-N-acetylmuramoyl-tripeptide--D-alanyl-D-alanine ligase [Saprospiraceae bacterium]MBP6566466.1 UDP-N-acetylmuramoyl-tripeptide--D-alanyl-D-alanine ligase [Saprospiraceae bacterium]